MGWSAENIEGRRKQTEEKHWKLKRMENEDYVESQITTIYIFSFKLYFPGKHDLKKSCLYYQILSGLQDIWNTVGSDTPNLNIHKYTNYNIIEIYINRLSTTTQISIAMDYLIMMSEKWLYFRKRKKHVARSIFTHPTEITGYMYFEIFFWIMSLPMICAKT